jgi:hypothetical protein
MTQDEVQMPPYLNASFEGDDLYTGDQVRELMKLVAAKEREACAKVCDKHAEIYASLPKTLTTDTSWAACIDNRDAIRARGEA